MDTVAVFLGFIIGGLICSTIILMIRPRETGDPISHVKESMRILESNHWSLLVRPVDGRNVFGLITDRRKKEHNVSGRMRDRGHIISLTGDEEWDEWLDYYNSLTGNIDELVATDGTAVMTMAMTRNLDDNIRDIKWFIPRPQAEYLKQRADDRDAMAERVHTAERDLEGVDNLRVMFHRDRKKLQMANRALNAENDMLSKQANENLITKSNLEREVSELKEWKNFMQRFFRAGGRNAAEASEFLTTSYQEAARQHLMKSGEVYDKVNTKIPPSDVQKTKEEEVRGMEAMEKSQQLAKKEGEPNV